MRIAPRTFRAQSSVISNMKIKHLFVFTLILTSALPAFGGIEELCFKNAGLKDEETISLKIDESRVTGTYKIMWDYSADTVETFDFTGTRAGKSLKIKFKGNKLPSPSMKSLNWTLDDDGTKQTLRIKFNEKNYDTKKFEDSLVDFESCAPSYAELKKKAKRLSIQQAGPSKETVKFSTKDERHAFSINVPKGKALAVTAPMLSIAFFYPDGKQHGEASMDSFSSDKVSQGGDCLVVLHRYATPDGESAEGAEHTVEFSLEGSE